MANNIYQYGGQIKIDQSIEFQNKAPLDVRATVRTSDLLYEIAYPYVGLVSYVSNEGVLYVCTSTNGGEGGKSTWSKVVNATGTSGLQMYDTATINALSEKNELPEKYIVVDDSNTGLSQTGDPVTKTYEYSGDGSYADILFAAIREL
jgi:hypothetical protein